MDKVKRKLPNKQIPTLSLKDLANAFTPVDSDMMDEEWKREIEEDRESFSRMDKKYKIEIGWDQFNELQIQTLIAILFSNMGYSILHLHKADRAREEGADIIVKNSRNNIAIAVKIKPGNNDRQQLSDLSKRKENKKIYIHTQTPTGKFIDSMSEYINIVEFWDERKLNKFFVENNISFTCNLIFDSHELSNTINKARVKLFDIRDKCMGLQKVQSKKLDLQSFNFMWRLKDEAVSFQKTNQNIIPLIERPINIRNNALDEHFIKIFLEYLDILNTRLKDFIYFFDLFYIRNQDLVNNSVITYIDRSQWRNYLLQYHIDNSLASFRNELNSLVKERKTLKDKDERTYLKEISKNNDVWWIIETRVRNLGIFGLGIEAIIDDIKSEFAENFIS
jgi:hypothetical protein